MGGEGGRPLRIQNFLDFTHAQTLRTCIPCGFVKALLHHLSKLLYLCKLPTLIWSDWFEWNWVQIVSELIQARSETFLLPIPCSVKAFWKHRRQVPLGYQTPKCSEMTFHQANHNAEKTHQLISGYLKGRWLSFWHLHLRSAPGTTLPFSHAKWVCLFVVLNGNMAENFPPFGKGGRQKMSSTTSVFHVPITILLLAFGDK